MRYNMSCNKYVNKGWALIRKPLDLADRTYWVKINIG